MIMLKFIKDLMLGVYTNLFGIPMQWQIFSCE